jgi:predicted metal-dependent hydrolase
MAGIDPDRLILDLDGHQIVVWVRRSALAKRISLKADPIRGFQVVLPLRGSLDRARRFVAEQRHWLSQRAETLPKPVEVEAGAEIPVLGRPHAVIHRPEARRGVWIEDGRLCVSGQAEHVKRRALAFLRTLARHEITARVQAFATSHGLRPGRVTLRDTTSRWGSCSAKGDLSFCWRLVMAPDWVLTYVVAHEMAHLAEMNHSPAFWRQVARLCPDHARAKAWLKQHGGGLHQIR